MRPVSLENCLLRQAVAHEIVVIFLVGACVRQSPGITRGRVNLDLREHLLLADPFAFEKSVEHFVTV